MRAMIFDGLSSTLHQREVPDPVVGSGQLLIKVHVCGVCRTDLHVLDGDLREPKLPLIPGREIVGTVLAAGEGATEFAVGDRVGVTWLGLTCGHCEYCLDGRENLCNVAKFTGYTMDGGYAEKVLAFGRYCVHIPVRYSDDQGASLLCDGAVGYRALEAVGPAKNIGVYGFDVAADIVTQLAVARGKTVFAFTRKDDERAQATAKLFGAKWAGGSDETPPVALDAALIFAPVGALIPVALQALKKGGVVVCCGVHMSEIPTFSYDRLWGERRIVSVANFTRDDAHKFMRMADEIPLHVRVVGYPLEEANRALSDLREGIISGAVVLRMGEGR